LQNCQKVANDSGFKWQLFEILGDDFMKVGVDIGGSHIAIGVVNNSGRIVEKTEKRLTSVEKKNITKSIEDYIIEHTIQFMDKYEIDEMGIAIPGTAVNGVVLSAGNLKINNYNIVEKLNEKIKLPIRVRNDAKCAAIAENKYGCLKGYNISLFLTLGTGIGGAVFLDNKLLKGNTRPGYELGHMVIAKDGIECTCGKKGCFERYASMKVFKDNLRKALGLNETTRSEELLEIVRRNNPDNDNYEVIESIVSEYIENLSIGLINIIDIFEPEIIGIGGSFVYFEDVFLERLQTIIDKENAKKPARGCIMIKTAVLGNDAGMIGATLI